MMHPLISKPLSQTDIRVRFSVPMESLDAFGIPRNGNNIDLEAVDMEEKPWKFRITTRRNDEHPKPVISRGWIAYVQKKRLRRNDRLEIFRDEENKGKKRRYRVRALRKAFRLFGHDIWVDVEKLEKLDNHRQVV